MKTVINNLFSYCFKISIGLLIVLIGGMLFYYYAYPFYSNDSGFYLNIVRDLGLGNKYFVDINIGYTPLAIFTMGLPYFLFGVKGKLGALFINHLCVFLSSLIIYRLAIKFEKTKTISLFFSFLFSALMLYYDGRFVVLEPVTVLLQLSSLYFLLKYNGYNVINIFFAGIFLSLAFLSKQYALFLIPCFIYWLLICPNSIRGLIYIIAGGLLPITIFYFYFENLSILEYLKHLLAQRVYLEFGTGTGKEYTPFGIPWLKLKKLLLINFYIFFVLINVKKWKTDYKTIFFFASLPIASLSILYFAAYEHYYQLIIPYFIIFVIYLIPVGNFSNVKKVFVMLIISISLFTLSRRIYNNVLTHKQMFLKQAKDIKTVRKNIPEGTEVFLSGLSPAYYHLGNFKSINLKKIGYGFHSYYSPETITSLMRKFAVIVVNEEYLLKYELLKNNFYPPVQINLNNEIFYILKKNN